MQRVGPISATAVADFEMVPIMDAVGIERGESRGAAASYSTRGYCSRKRDGGPAARAMRGAGNAGRGASPTAGEREGFSF
jgi:hypothetical protein